MLISDRIFEILKKKKMTQKELAKKTGIGEGTISDWRRRSLNPSADRIVPIAEALGVSPLELLGVKASKEQEYLKSAEEYEREKAANEAAAKGAALSEEETQLVELYRRMPEDKRAKLMNSANFYVKIASFED